MRSRSSERRNKLHKSRSRSVMELGLYPRLIPNYSTALRARALTTTLHCFAEHCKCAGKWLWKEWVKNTISSFRQETLKLFSRVNLVLFWRVFWRRFLSVWKLVLTRSFPKYFPICSTSSTLSPIAQDGEGRGCLWTSGNSTFIFVAKVVTQLSWVYSSVLPEAVWSRLSSLVLL